MTDKEISIDFVKAHAGFDEVIFVPGDEVPEGKEIEIGLQLLARPNLRGTEVGFLYESEDNGNIKVKILDRSKKDFISMCGGLTQTLGKVLVETNLGEQYGIKIKEPMTNFTLETEAGNIPVKVNVKNGLSKKVITNMNNYVNTISNHELVEVCVDDIKAFCIKTQRGRIEWLIFQMNELNDKYPKTNFWSKDQTTLDILKEIFESFIERIYPRQETLYSAFYEIDKGGGENNKKKARVLFRWYPEMYQPYYRERNYEESCGTGSTIIGIAMEKNGILCEGKSEITLNYGSEDLVSIENRIKTELIINVQNNMVKNAKFSHNLVELIASGQIYLPL